MMIKVMAMNEELKNELGQIVIFNTEDGEVHVQVDAVNETIWLNQKAIAELFGVSVPNISYHFKKIFADEELKPDTVIKEILITAQSGARGLSNEKIKFYNLDAIISVGYRVNSKRATAFRIWATDILKSYMLKGFALDDNRLKNLGGGSYWKELLDRIRDIRSSEKVLYRQVLDLYATSIDYDPKSEESIRFFKIVQNKLHYAAHGHTASELIYERADADKPFMGLTNFHGEQPTKKDILIAKNYMNEDELKILNNLVSGYFDFAEIQAIRHNQMTMKDYINHLDLILSTTGERQLNDAGKVSHKQAEAKAIEEYRKYQVQTLSPVELAYLDTLKSLEKTAKDAMKK